jgi:hypothetical protein
MVASRILPRDDDAVEAELFASVLAGGGWRWLGFCGAELLALRCVSMLDGLPRI